MAENAERRLLNLLDRKVFDPTIAKDPNDYKDEFMRLAQEFEAA